ncbi:MAG: L-glutamate gamma-semialdehyde dehydrogenase [Pseudomonadota bacterium]|nr:L-glutamate gamma-semialdehyde dehydrogenase [Pseudomonadota bacterium]
MAIPASLDDHLEHRVQETGRRLIAAFEQRRQAARSVDLWLDRFLNQVMTSEAFRVQALRFVDVLPALDNDRELTEHLHEYFGHGDFPLTGLLRFGVRHVRGDFANAIIGGAVRKAMSGLARRFLGGASVEEAVSTAEALRKRGIGSSIDLVGEAVVSDAEAEDYQRRYLDFFARIPQKAAAWPPHPVLDQGQGRRLPRLNASIKLSSLDPQLSAVAPEAGAARIAARLKPILLAARRGGSFVCVDMEQFHLKETVLSCFKQLLMEPELREWPDAGIALQAYLRETEADINDLSAWAARRGTPITVRLVRGAYWDYETVIAEQHGWPLPVWTKKWQTDACYERCVRLLFEHHPRIEAAVATHNLRSVAFAMVLAEEHGITRDQFEFQMLHGMASGLEDVLAEMGYRLRMYVPFGELLPGMAYLVRRLLENSSSQSFQRMNQARTLAAGQLLASPHGDDPAAETAPRVAAGARVGQGGAEAAGARTLPRFRNEPPHRFTDPSERSAFQGALSAARTALGGDYPLQIDGKAVGTKDQLLSVNPARPDEVIGRVARAGTGHADRAVSGALRAFADWSRRAAGERAHLLLCAAKALRRQRDEFAALEILEAGKTWVEADANVAEAIDYLEYYAREALRWEQPRCHDVPGEENVYRYAPRGVGAIISPWNFPLAILTGMLSAAIAAGNTVVLKPSSQTPVIAARFVRLLQEAGVPPAVVQYLPGAGGTLGEYLVRHPQVAFVAFTGSEEVGRRILRLAADFGPGQSHVKQVIAEMGGKNAIIIDNDADLDEAVTGVVQSAFGYQGQKCSACSRVIVLRQAYDRFLERLLAATRSVRIGMPETPAVFMGPLIDAGAKARVIEAIERGRAGGAELALAMPCPDLGGGYFVGPAIFTGVAPDSYLAQTEIFGPVLAVMRVADLDTAIRVANQTPYALTGGIYSRSPSHVLQASRELQVGNLYINRKITGAWVERQPFGGFKMSGVGSKAGGPDYLLQFMIPRTVTENTLRRGFAPAGRAGD